MSDFYRLKRIAIKDVFAGVGFAAGFIGSAPFAWPRLTAHIQIGDITTGLFYFLFFVLVGATLAGIVSLLLGIGAGALWERWHRSSRRNYVPANLPSGFFPDAGASAIQPEQRAITFADANIRFGKDIISPADFMSLAERVWPGTYDERRAADALVRTTNIGAWRDSTLIGIVRMMSDGYFFTAVTEILVDPDYRRRGVGRELMNRALDASPASALVFGAEPSAAVFFEHIGSERRLIGFTLRKPSATRRVAVI